MDIDYITGPENFVPNQDGSSFNKVEAVLSGKMFEPIDSVLILLRNSFCHDMWQRLYSKGFNEDPFELPAYRLFFFLNTFRVFLSKIQTNTNLPTEVKNPSEKCLSNIYARLYKHFIEAAKDPNMVTAVSWDGELLTNYSIDTKPEWELILRHIELDTHRSEVEGYLGAINVILDVSRNKHTGKTDKALSKILFINYASILEVVLVSLNTKKKSNYKFASLNLGRLTTDYIKFNKANLNTEITLLSLFFNHLRNLIHVGNATVKNDDLGYNLTVAKPLYGFVRSLSLDLLTYKSN